MEFVEFEDLDDIDDGSTSASLCTKLSLPEHLAAYIEKRELSREVEEVVCNNNLKENVMNNYIVVRRILSNLSWQDKMLCKHVCKTWRAAIISLQKEQLCPSDFVVDMHLTRIKHGFKFKHSVDFYTEPLVVFTFVNETGVGAANKCMVLLPSPCDPPCEREHCLYDYVQNKVSAPKDCMLTVRACYLSYRPLAQSCTYEYTVTNHALRRMFPFIGGVFIPVIPDVKFHVIHVKPSTDIQLEFYDVLTNLAKDRIFKGVLVYVTEKFILQSFIEECTYLNYFKEIQPDVPYALGGCIIEDTLELSDTNQVVECQHSFSSDEDNCFVSENLISIGMFTVPKYTSSSEDKNNFDMYSLVIESPDWSKPKIERTIEEFSKKVPRFEHSIALKLACVGRDQKHDVEEDFFRAQFPNTRIVGCFGNGELGINHPTRPPAETPPTKRNRQTPPPLGILYSYSTVFVYIGWGKKLPVQP